MGMTADLKGEVGEAGLGDGRCLSLGFVSMYYLLLVLPLLTIKMRPVGVALSSERLV